MINIFIKNKNMLKKQIILKDSLPIILTDGCNFETVMSQIQPYVEDTIFSIKNGDELKIFKKIEEIPKDMIRESSSNESNINYFRSKKDGDLYSFFGDDVLEIINNRINKPKILKDTILQDGKLYYTVHFMHKRAKLTKKRINY